jgi:hypothetical protein
MTASFYICITSGMRGPELELTPEQIAAIVKLAEGLTQPWDGSTLAEHGLGPDHFAVSWEDKDGYCGLWTESSGYVRLWKNGDTDWTRYKDTVGLWAHLAQFAGPANEKWQEDLKREMAAYQGYPFSIFKVQDP